MASIIKITREYAEEIRDGIAWVIIWKVRRSWNAESVYLKSDDKTFEPEDIPMVQAIVKQDPNAIMVNGYYCEQFSDMTLADIACGIRWYYENGFYLLKNSVALP